VRSQTIERINSYSFDGEAVLTAGDGVGTGKIFHYINGKFDLHQRVYQISNFSPRLNGFFFYLYFASKFFDRIMSMTAKSSVDSVRREMIADMLMPLPPPDEQRAIAAALADADALIAALDGMIAKKRDLKQAAMQHLLTSKTRLPGFTGEWEVKRLGDLCTMRSGEGITAKNIDETSAYPCYGGNGLRGYTTRFTHQGRYALIGRVGALCGNVLLADGNFFASEHAIVVSSFDRVDIGWLAMILGTLGLNRRAESSAQPVLTVSKLLILEVLAPPTKAEQTAIAEVLSDMDADLVALEQQRDKTRALKQGMMQALLTGKIRLISSNA
jgi:type I restriction enzyme S subunit